ncbi:MAG: hypothetical protein WCA35_01245 [Kovacikia sp.]
MKIEPQFNVSNLSLSGALKAMARRQHYLFVHKYLQKVFYQNPYRVFEHLRSEMGAVYLSQLWQDTADEFSLEKKDVVDPTGLRIDYQENESYGLIIISLPLPKTSPEAYFVGMRSNYSDEYEGAAFRYFTLEREDIGPGSSSTLLCEWTANGDHLSYVNEVGATLDQFVDAIEKLVAPKNTAATTDFDDPVEVERPAHISYVHEPVTTRPSNSPQNFLLQEVERLINPKRNSSNTSTENPSIGAATSAEQIQEAIAKKLSELTDNFHTNGSSNNYDCRIDPRTIQSQKSAPHVFQGVFKPPIISLQTTPIKITGLGYCETKSDGLKVQGFKQTPRFSSSQLAIIFLVCYFGGKLIGGVVGILLVIPAVALLYSSLRGQGIDHKDEPLELIIPWDNIPRARFDRISGTVVINVKNFRHQRDSYKGALFFHPSGKPDHLLNALQAHNVKCKY